MNEKLTLKVGELPDWYTIELAEHENKHGMERVSDSVYALTYTGRISDACVEGTAQEMLSIAAAIENGESVFHRRCAVEALADGTFAFCSPRNSQRPGLASGERARELAAEIRRVLQPAVAER